MAQVFGTTSEHPSKYLTPQKVHQILESAEMGDVVAQSELFVDMEEKDGHIFTEMSKRKRALVGCDWTVVPPKNASAAELALTDEVADWLEEVPDFEDVLMDLLDALAYLYDILADPEFVFLRDDRKKPKKKNRYTSPGAA